MKKSIAVLFGGISSEHEVSLWSATHIINSLNKEPEKYNVLPIGVTKTGEWFLYTGPSDYIANNTWFKDTENLHSATLSPSRCNEPLLILENGTYKTKKIDVVFPVLHGKNGEDGTIQGLCELSGIAYVGCDVGSSSVCIDKVFTNILLTEKKINKAKYIWFFDYDYLKDPNKTIDATDTWINNKYPVFVKPAKSGSSVGISKVLKKQELKDAIEKAILHDSKILIEEGIDARELECAVLGEGNDVFVSIVGEIIPFNNFYDYESKYYKNSKLIEHADLLPEIQTKIQKMAKDAYCALGCSGLARVDFLLDKNTNKIFLNELNTMPGFTDISMYLRLLLKSGFTMSGILERLINFAYRKKAFKDAKN